MDITGLSVGVVALATLFKTCLELYDRIDSSKKYGADYEILSTKVGVERVRLLLWGESLGLTTDSRQAITENASADDGDGLDSRLNDTRIRKAVSDILSCMKQLFEDTDKMTRRYGLKTASSADLKASIAGPSQLALVSQDSTGNALVHTFKRAYEKFNLTAAANQQNATLGMTTRWAIKDKRRFERFVEDLRGFNDSLNALFPDIDEHTREEMVADIKSSTNLEDLQVIEQATDNDEALIEAASIRISEISQHTRAYDDDSDGGNDTETVSDSYAAGSGVNVNKLAKQLEKLEVVMAAQRKGAVGVSIRNSYGNKYYAYLHWQDLHNDEHFENMDKELEYVQNPYLAWSLMYATDRGRMAQGNYSSLDSEAGKKFEGRYPGTRTVEGYAADFQEWAEDNIPQPSQTIFSSSSELPPITMEDIVARINELQVRKGFPWGWSDEEKRKDLEKLIGNGGYTHGLQDHMMQVIAILDQLNRIDIFDDIRDANGSLGTLASAPPGSGYMGLGSFLFQMVLSYELVLRLKQDHGSAFGGMTKQVTASMQASERWLDSVRCSCNENKPGTLSFYSLVHERQVDGLLRFAEVMSWPYLSELRGYAEDVYANVRAGGKVNIYLWDWLMGTVMPGQPFILTIMAALVTATPSLEPIGLPHWTASNIILSDRSYWRARSVVGRVFGGLRTIKGVNGWIGPCPVPIKDATAVTPMPPGWLRLQERSAPFTLPDPNRIFRGIPDEDGLFSRVHHASSDRSRGEWVLEMGDASRWIIPKGPGTSTVPCDFLRLRLAGIPQGEGETGAPIFPGMADASPQESKRSEILRPAGREPTCRASMDFQIGGNPVSFVLYFKPTFVAAPRCLDGPHGIHERDLPKLQCIKTVDELKGYIHNSDDHRVLVINATGSDHDEMAARAWCAENGRHAMIRRTNGPCFACTVRNASMEGLGVGCVIWS